MVEVLFTNEGCSYSNIDESYTDLERTRSNFVVQKELMAVGMRQRLGSLWLMLDPIFYTLVYYLVFDVLRANPNTSSIIIGIGMMRVLQDSFSAGVSSVANFTGGIKAERLRTRVLVIAMLKSRVINTLFQTVAISVVLVLGLGHEYHVGFAYLLSCQMVGILSQGAGMNLTMITRRIPDLRKIISYGLRVFFYMSPCLYPMSKTTGLHYKILTYNPYSYFVEWVREVANLESAFNELDMRMLAAFLLLLLFLTSRGIYSVDSNRWETSTWT